MKMAESQIETTASEGASQDATDPALLRQYLAGREVPCPRCQYMLRDLTGEHCPECGEKLTLSVRPAQVRLGPFITALIALGATAGVWGWHSIDLANAVLRYSSFLNVTAWIIFGVIGLFLATSVVGLKMWIARRNRLAEISPRKQWIWAGLCCLLLTVTYLLPFIMRLF